MTDLIRAALERLMGLRQYTEIFPEHDTDSIVARARAAPKADRPSTSLAVHPDGTPMVSIGEAADLDTIARLAEEPMIPSCYRGHEIAVYRDGFHAGYKKALSRSANTTPQPVPVSERLPGEEDCDAESQTTLAVQAAVRDALAQQRQWFADLINEQLAHLERYSTTATVLRHLRSTINRDNQ